MLNAKTLIIIFLILSLDFVQSEKLPRKQLSGVMIWESQENYRKKIATGRINILSFNVWGLPISLSGHDQQRRFEAMGDSLKTIKADIIGLQETFHPLLRENLLTSLSQNFYAYSDFKRNRTVLPFIHMDCYGGLMTFSVFPILKETFYPFPIEPNTSIIEKIGKKGFLISYIQHGENIIRVINTHLYAGNNPTAEKMRLNQIKYIHEILANEETYCKETFLIGDFNIHHPSVAYSEVYEYIVGNMSFDDSKPEICDDDYTYDFHNAYTPLDEKRSKLDYVFIHESQKRTANILSQSRTFDTQPISDHYGWKVCLKI